MNYLEKPLSGLLQRVEGKPRKRIAVAAAEDKAVLQSIQHGMAAGIIEPVLVGNRQKIESLLNEINLNGSSIKIIHEENPEIAAIKAVQVINEGGAEILMKGDVGTKPLLTAVLDKEKGLRKSGTLSHFALFDIPTYHKILALSDAAM